MTSDTTPGSIGLDALIPPNPDAAPGEPAKKRPTTRAGREAAKAANAAKKAAGGKDAAPKASTPRPRKDSLENRLASSITTVGLGIVTAGAMTSSAVQVDGIIIIENAPPVAKALADIAAGNPAVAKTLERVLTAGTYAALGAAVMPIAIGIGANHGLIPGHVADLVGVKLPDLAEFTPPPAAPTPAGAPASPSPGACAPGPAAVSVV